jgi:hypothetical protein
MQHKVLEAAVNRYGAKKQITMAVEEMAELIQQLAKFINDRGNKENVCEEIADVSIMLDQLFLIFDPFLIKRFREQKLDRLQERLGKRES